MDTQYLSTQEYQSLYDHSIQDPATFWEEQAKQFITWFEPWKKVCTGNFTNLDLHWFQQGKLNASYNCLDRHLSSLQDKIAIIWEGDSADEVRKITYKELHEEVCRFANALKNQNVKKGDRVCIYLPMIPEAVVAMLACARIGAIHSVVFGGFSAEALHFRILDSDCQIVITADESLRGGKIIPLKINTDKALEHCPNVRNVIVVKRTGNKIPWSQTKDKWYHELIMDSSPKFEAEIMDAEDPLFVLYTSGSTGLPKGILHGTGGYLVYAATTFHYVFNYQNNDVFWCTADVGWITGHTYVVYAPLLNGATIVIYEGVPNHPNFSRYWEIVDRYQVTIFYSSPTAIRSLRHEGDSWIKKSSRKSLRLLGTVGEPINPEVWEWYYEIVGDERCPIVDTWWQTETGGVMISPIPGATKLKPGSVTKPFFGILPQVVDDNGNELGPNQEGRLVIAQPWPGFMLTVWNNRERFINGYFKPVPGKYFSGDLAHYDEQGYFWIGGRADDVIKVSGHRISTAEIESALLSDSTVSEAAVVAIPDEIKGQAICAYVTLKQGITPSEDLKKQLILVVREQIGAIATPKIINWAVALPKTRSGKIMRRILHKIASNDYADLGDLSTLADPSVVTTLIAQQEKNRT